jgi:PDZ domain-containing protein
MAAPFHFRVAGRFVPGFLAAALATAAWSDITFRRPTDRPEWPRGTELIRFERRDSLVNIRAQLRSRSGREVSGVLIFDTGSPAFVVKQSVWNALEVDTIEMHGSYVSIVRRPLQEVRIGDASLPDIPISGLLADSLLDEDVLGVFAPSSIEDRGLVLDYDRSLLALVPPAPALVAADSVSGPERSASLDGRRRRSKAAYAAVLRPEAIAVPFDLYAGGRMLLSVEVVDPSLETGRVPFTLLLDTGASVFTLFQDVVGERMPQARRWPRLRDQPFRTVLGSSSEDLTVLPRVALPRASQPLSIDRVEAGVVSRGSLPELEGSIPARIHGMLGNSFLARYRMLVDYRNQMLWLEPKSHAPESALHAAHVGIRLETRWGRLWVKTVRPGSSADRAGIQPGDVIVAIDGASGLAAERAERLLEGDANTEVTLVVRRQSVERILKLKRQPVSP